MNNNILNHFRNKNLTWSKKCNPKNYSLTWINTSNSWTHKIPKLKLLKYGFFKYTIFNFFLWDKNCYRLITVYFFSHTSFNSLCVIFQILQEYPYGLIFQQLLCQDYNKWRAFFFNMSYQGSLSGLIMNYYSFASMTCL